MDRPAASQGWCRTWWWLCARQVFRPINNWVRNSCPQNVQGHTSTNSSCSSEGTFPWSLSFQLTTSCNVTPSHISWWYFGNDRSLHSEISTVNFFLHRYESVALKPDSKPTIVVHWLQEALDKAQSELRTYIFMLPKEKFPLLTFLRPSKHFSTVLAFRARLRYTPSSTFAAAEEEALHTSMGFLVGGEEISSTKSIWIDKHPSSAWSGLDKVPTLDRAESVQKVTLFPSWANAHSCYLSNNLIKFTQVPNAWPVSFLDN